MKKLIPMAALFWIMTAACNEAETTTSLDTTQQTTTAEAQVSAIDTAASDNDAVSAGSYTQTTFSRYVYEKSGEDVFLIDFNFFPEGTDFDSQAKTAALPCETTTDTDAAIDVNATEEEDCDKLTVDLSSATFTFIGLEISHDESQQLFVEDFEFKITTDGFVDPLDGATLDVAADTATLESVYNAVMDKRTE